MGLIPFPSQSPWSDISPWLGKPSQVFLQYLSSLDKIVRLIVSQGGAPRTVLSQPTTFYIATNGSDSNDGLSPSTPWLTFAHAMAVITGQIDFGGQTVTLQAVAGHAAFTITLTISPWTGGGALIVDLGGGGITTTGDLVLVTGSLPGVVTVRNGTLTGGTHLLAHIGFGQVLFNNITFGTASGAHILAQGGGAVVQANGAYIISGNAPNHVQMQDTQFTAAGITIIINGALTFSAVVSCLVGVVDFSSTTWDKTTHPGSSVTVSGGASCGFRLTFANGIRTMESVLSLPHSSDVLSVSQ